DIALRHEALARVPALASRRLVLVQVSLVCLHAGDLPRAGHAKPLLRSAVALLLGHGVTSFGKSVKGNCTREGAWSSSSNALEEVRSWRVVRRVAARSQRARSRVPNSVRPSVRRSRASVQL